MTTPAQGVGLAAMFGACAIVTRAAWVLTRASEAPPGMPGSLPLVRFLALFALRTWLLLLGAGVPAAVRAIRTR